MNEIPVKLGPLALLLAVISICMTTLAILTFSTGRADQSLAEKYAGTVRERYELEAKGQKLLSEISDDLTQGFMLMPDADGLIHEQVEEGNTTLSIAIKPVGMSDYTVESWRIERKWEEDTGMGNLWDGTW